MRTGTGVRMQMPFVSKRHEVSDGIVGKAQLIMLFFNLSPESRFENSITHFEVKDHTLVWVNITKGKCDALCGPNILYPRHLSHYSSV